MVLKTPVLFLVFNRLETTKKVFEEIRKAKPPRLYIGSDGARENIDSEIIKVDEVRNYVINNIDWNCEVKTLFREKNLGCKYAVSGSIDWFFNKEEMGIILEDDCLPSQSFFWFCEELLEKYREDERVGQISGFNHGFKDSNLKYDYFYSKYPSIWGWASWKRAWKEYDLNMEDYDEIISSGLMESIFHDKYERRSREKIFEDTRNGKIDTWDYQWSYALYKNNQFTIIPKKNLILNIGFGDYAMHTKGRNPYLNLECENYNKDLIHAKYFIQNNKFYRLIVPKMNCLKKLKLSIKLRKATSKQYS